MDYILKQFDPAIHHRQSIRRKGFDYCRPGLYFITMRTQTFQCLFGEIRSGIMHLNEFGKIVADEWLKTSLIRPYIQLDAYVVMPDHFHGIIVIKPHEIDSLVGATRRVAPAGRPHAGRPNGPPPGSIGAIVGQFKMQTTKQINILRYGTTGHFPRRIGDGVWQRNYYDRIIHDEVALRRIREYIINNPAKAANKQRKP